MERWSPNRSYFSVIVAQVSYKLLSYQKACIRKSRTIQKSTYIFKMNVESWTIINGELKLVFLLGTKWDFPSVHGNKTGHSMIFFVHMEKRQNTFLSSILSMSSCFSTFFYFHRTAFKQPINEAMSLFSLVIQMPIPKIDLGRTDIQKLKTQFQSWTSICISIAVKTITVLLG